METKTNQVNIEELKALEALELLREQSQLSLDRILELQGEFNAEQIPQAA